jgi:hypothetical protein
MRLCSLLGILGALFVLGWLVLSTLLWRKEREASRRHKEALRACSTEELRSRAWNWGHLELHADTPAVKEFRALLEQQRYEAILHSWRALALGLFAVGEELPPTKPEFRDSESSRALRDCVEVLLERQHRGE